MPARLPDGEPAPPSGALPESALAGLGSRPFGIYLHVPFCVARCGYCDFNTYTAAELGSGVSQAAYPRSAIAEMALARKVLGEADLPVRTVFFGGGTPTVLAPRDLGAMLRAIDTVFGLAADAEVTIEANPESVNRHILGELREVGFNRISFGMQSAAGHVLAVLDRTHTPGRATECVAEARSAGFDHVNLDLIYGTPGESHDDWIRSLEAALAAGPDHISAYALTIEEGTRLASRVKRGELPPPDDDVMADRYLLADNLFTAHGLRWYEISNWAASETGRCHHNLLYWTGGDWWGIGPGAHSHVAGIRWWNVKHPASYAERLATGVSPGYAREVLTDEDRRIERIMLELRLASGCPLELLTEGGQAAAKGAVARDLLAADAHETGRAALTLRGRLLADAVVRELVG